MEDPRKNITLSAMVLVNVVNLGVAGFWAFNGGVMPLYLATRFGLSNFETFLVLGIGKLMIVMSMFFGIFSDHTQTRMGKRKPLILIGGLLSAPLIALIPHVPAIPMLLIILTVVYFGIQFAAVPYFSLVPEVVPNEKLGTANAFFSVFGGVGTLLAYAFILAFVYKTNKYMAFYFMGAIHFIGTLVTVLSTKEHLGESPAKVNKFKVMVGSISEIIKDIPNYPSLFRFLIFNLFFWAGLGAFVELFSKMMEYYVNIPGESAGYVLGTVVGVSILLAVPVGILGDKLSRKNMTMAGITFIFLGLGAGYFLVGPTSDVSGVDLADSAAVVELGSLFDVDTSSADLSIFSKEEFEPPLDVNEDEMNDKKSDVMRWCLNGAFGEEDCREGVIAVMGEDNPALESTYEAVTGIGRSVQGQTNRVLMLSFIVIAFTAVGLTICFVIMAAILPTLMPHGKLGLYMGFYSTLTGLGQLVSFGFGALIIDLTLNISFLGYRWLFMQGCFFELLALIALSRVKYIPNAGEPQISELEKDGKEFRL